MQFVSHWLRRIILITFATGILVGGSYLVVWRLGAAESNPIESVAVGSTIEDRYVQNDAFGVGEKLEFDINYGFINAGTATLEVASLVDYKGRPSYQIISTAHSNDFFTTLYPVDDRIESIIDANGLFSWRFDKRIREGNYRAERKYEFDQLNRQVIYKDSTYQLDPFTQDALSSIYFIRCQPLVVGKSFFLQNFIDGHKNNIEVKILRKERITVKAGEFDCLVVEPLTNDVGLFKHEGKLTVWLTDDRLRLPVLMKSKIIVGSVVAELTSFKLGELAEL